MACGADVCALRGEVDAALRGARERDAGWYEADGHVEEAVRVLLGTRCEAPTVYSCHVTRVGIT